MIQWIARILLIAGTIVAAVSAARIPPAWVGFAIGMLVLVAGIVLGRIAARGKATQAGAAGRVEEARDALRNLESGVGKLLEESRGMEAREIHGRIDELVKVHVYRFVELRNSVGATFGMKSLGLVMNFFATGERYLNRGWSASTDGDAEEALASVSTAHYHLKSAHEILESLLEESSVNRSFLHTDGR